MKEEDEVKMTYIKPTVRLYDVVFNGLINMYKP